MIPLKLAILHNPMFLPGQDGKGVNLKNTLDVDAIEGTSKKLKLTLKDTLIYIETATAYGFVPVTNFSVLIPAERLTDDSKKIK